MPKSTSTSTNLATLIFFIHLYDCNQKKHILQISSENNSSTVINLSMSFSFQLQFPTLFLLLLLSFSLSSSSAQQSLPPDSSKHFCIDTNGNYTKNTTFATNLNTVFSTLASTNSTGNFHTLTAGDNSGVDQVNAIALCWADISPSDCKSCLSDATRKIRQLCPNQKEAIGWYVNCMFRYSTRSISDTMETDPAFGLLSHNVAPHMDTFKEQLGKLLRQLGHAAAAGDSRRKYAYGYAGGAGDATMSVYGKVQCTPDLSRSECLDCLDVAVSGIPECCGSQGALIGLPSCGIRYDTHQSYNSLEDDELPITIAAAPAPAPAPAPFNSATNGTAPAPFSSASNGTAQGKQNNVTTKVAIAIAVPIAALIGLSTIICIFLTRRKRISKKFKVAEDDYVSLQSDFNTIRAATNNFSNANKIGQGGFGIVYKGRLANGEEIAVKRLSRNAGQGDDQFRSEVLLLAKLQHKNLVRLLGFCLKHEEKLLIYEFLPNASLDHILFDPAKRAYLDWNTRYKIISGIARGLLYLHEDSRLRIIHRDLKVSNILLDEELNPKIADFGLARLFDADQTHADTSRIAGTYGYMAPEYAMHGLFSVKSDVYSFGILMLEIITGRKNSGFHNGEFVQDLVSSVWENWRQGTALSIVDPTLSVRSTTQVKRCIHMGLLCVQDSEEDRPTMSSIVVMLGSHSVALPAPSYPAFVTRSDIEPVYWS